MPPKDFAMACVLCRKDRELEESHILSKFIYKLLKEPEGKMYVLSEDPSQKNRTRQDGVKEYLLCGECEDKREKWETYFSNKWHRGELFGKSNPYRIEGLDYCKFKLFLMSALFMASVSRDPLFEGIELTPSSFEKLRQMVDAGDPGQPDEYGCSIMMLEDGEKELDPKILIGNAVTIKKNGFRMHRFLFGGFFLGFIEPEGMNIGQGVRKAYITKEGNILIRKKKIRDLGYLMNTFWNLKGQGKLDEEKA